MLQNPELHYLDNAATTIVAPEVADVINKAMREHWANPSSLYAPGARSEEALNAARAAVARTLGCKSRELYFTSCGSESNNMALLGAALTRRFGKGIVVSGFEHPSVQKPLERLAAMGYDVTVVAPGPDGTLDIDRMLEHVDKNTILVACMMVNNEVGTRNDVERLAAEVKRRNSRTIVHVDAVQAWMRVPIKLANIDTLAVSGHKIHAPKGIGALYLSDSLYQAFQAPYLGGEQEREKRPGTENLPYALGLAAAATRLNKTMKSRDAAVRALNLRMREGLKAFPEVVINSPDNAVPEVLNFSENCIKSETMLACLLGQCLRPGPAQPYPCRHGQGPAGHRHGHPRVLLCGQHPRGCGRVPQRLRGRNEAFAENQKVKKESILTLSGRSASSSPKGGALDKTGNFAWNAKVSHFGGGGSASALTERVSQL